MNFHLPKTTLIQPVIAGKTGNLHTDDHTSINDNSGAVRRCKKYIYIYPRGPAFERGTPLASALQPGRKYQSKPWLLAVSQLPASWARDCAVAAVSLLVTKDAERAKRVERWPRRRSGSERG